MVLFAFILSSDTTWLCSGLLLCNFFLQNVFLKLHLVEALFSSLGLVLHENYSTAFSKLQLVEFESYRSSRCVYGIPFLGQTPGEKLKWFYTNLNLLFFFKWKPSMNLNIFLDIGITLLIKQKVQYLFWCRGLAGQCISWSKFVSF